MILHFDSHSKAWCNNSLLAAQLVVHRMLLEDELNTVQSSPDSRVKVKGNICFIYSQLPRRGELLQHAQQRLSVKSAVQDLFAVRTTGTIVK